MGNLIPILSFPGANDQTSFLAHLEVREGKVKEVMNESDHGHRSLFVFRIEGSVVYWHGMA
jgi:hypothetical protein